jgi:ParB-like chromosome segregation protein Spo0J
MRAGAQFPPITVALLDGRHYVLDGWHRVEALRMLGEQRVRAVVRPCGSRADAFVEAVRLNISHGRQLSVQERVRIVDRLKAYGLSLERISEIVRVPVEGLRRLEARAVKAWDGRPVYVKAPVARAAAKSGEPLPEAAVAVDQSKLYGRDVVDMLEQLVEILEANLFPWADERAAGLARRLYELLGAALR